MRSLSEEENGIADDADRSGFSRIRRKIRVHWFQFALSVHLFRLFRQAAIEKQCLAKHFKADEGLVRTLLKGF